MSPIADAWLSHPEVQSLLDRAREYRHHTYAETGSLPDRFMVTEEEYCLLKRCLDGGDFMQPQVPINDEIQIMGMRVCRPEHHAWYQDNLYMDHFKRLRPIQAFDLFPPLPISFEACRTERPPMPQPEVTCPCGEVIWDLSTCQWTEVYTLADMQMSYDIAIPADEQTVFMMRQYGQAVTARMERVFVHACQPRVLDPLPPLDDLDEGLQCCGRPYLTFADFMAHRRKHGEG